MAIVFFWRWTLPQERTCPLTERCLTPIHIIFLYRVILEPSDCPFTERRQLRFQSTSFVLRKGAILRIISTLRKWKVITVQPFLSIFHINTPFRPLFQNRRWLLTKQSRLWISTCECSPLGSASLNNRTSLLKATDYGLKETYTALYSRWHNFTVPFLTTEIQKTGLLLSYVVSDITRPTPLGLLDAFVTTTCHRHKALDIRTYSLHGAESFLRS